MIGLVLLVASPCLGQSPSPFQSVPAPAPAPAKPATKAHRSPDDSDAYPPPATDTTAAPAAAAPTPAPAPAVAQPPTPAPATAPLPAVAPAPPGAVPVATGTISVIREISVWNAFCRALPVSVAVIAQPQHGAIALRDEGVPIPAQPMFGTSGRCAGNVIAGKRLYYQSQAGFHGADRVVYIVSQGPGPGRTVVIDIAVR
jgi:hypothetical protein